MCLCWDTWPHLVGLTRGGHAGLPAGLLLLPPLGLLQAADHGAVQAVHLRQVDRAARLEHVISISISTHLEVALQITPTFRLGPDLLSSWPSSMAPLVVSSSSLWKYRSSRDQPSTTTTAKLRRGSRLQL